VLPGRLRLLTYLPLGILALVWLARQLKAEETPASPAEKPTDTPEEGGQPTPP
jgi:hypothetical protein